MTRSLRSAVLAASLLTTSAMIIPFASGNKGNAAPEVPPAPPAPNTQEGSGASAAPALVAGTVSDIESGIPVPTRAAGKGGGASPYKANIERLEVGQSFHVAGKTKKSLNSTMHTFNKNYREIERDAAGNAVTELKVSKKKDGTEVRKNVEKYTETRKFEHFDVDASDPRGPGVRIFRVK